jgi:hypothetical protein
VIAAIDRWISSLVSDAVNGVLNALATTVMSTPNLAADGNVVRLWTQMLVIADALIGLFVLAGAVILMSHETLQTRYGLKEILPRLVIGVVAANASLSLVGLETGFANALARAVMGSGISAQDVSASLGNLVTNAIAGNVFIALVGLAFAVMAAVVIVTYLIRIAVFIVLIIAAPFALITYCLPQTEAVAWFWWRATTGVFGVQLGQSLVLLAAVRVMFNGQSNADILNPLRTGGALIDLLAGCCLMLLLIRIPVWTTHTVLGGGHRSRTAGMLRNILLYKGFTAAGITGSGSRFGFGHGGGGRGRGGGPRSGGPAGGVRRATTADLGTGRQLPLFGAERDFIGRQNSWGRWGPGGFANSRLTRAVRERTTINDTPSGQRQARPGVGQGTLLPRPAPPTGTPTGHGEQQTLFPIMRPNATRPQAAERAESSAPPPAMQGQGTLFDRPAPPTSGPIRGRAQYLPLDPEALHSAPPPTPQPDPAQDKPPRPLRRGQAGYQYVLPMRIPKTPPRATTPPTSSTTQPEQPPAPRRTPRSGAKHSSTRRTRRNQGGGSR